MERMRQSKTRTVALLTALAIGLGIAVHEVFFLVAFAVLLFAFGETIHERMRMRHRHL